MSYRQYLPEVLPGVEKGAETPTKLEAGSETDGEHPGTAPTAKAERSKDCTIRDAIWSIRAGEGDVAVDELDEAVVVDE